MNVSLGHQISVNLETLVDTRLLIQANSGGGKSWAIRKLLEETHGMVQQIVLDIEGDFASLREKYDYILAGKGGDISVNPRSAELLAKKVLELRADLIADLYELKQHERIRFVKLFLDAMINAPKNLWHPVLVVIDEAHIFAPEKGQAESMGAVIDLETRGRKRGFCGILATQRLSKLHKDAAAECNNKLIGRTGLDIDLKRAADELGLATKDSLILRDLEPGEFYAFGPAISRHVSKVIVGEVKTHHPKAGNRKLLHTPEPTKKVRSILSKLIDLPREAEEEIRDKEAMKGKIRELERELRTKPKLEINHSAIKKSFEDGYTKALRELKGLIECSNRGFKKIKAVISEIEDIPIPKQAYYIGSSLPSIKPVPFVRQQKIESVDGVTIGKCERKILGFLKMKEGQVFSKIQIGAMTGYRHSSGGFNNAISRLSQIGLILRSGGNLQLNPNANGEVDKFVGEEIPHKLEDWINKLGACERAIYKLLLENRDTPFSKKQVAEQTGYSVESGGFNNAVSRLNTLGLIVRNSGEFMLNHDLNI